MLEPVSIPTDSVTKDPPAPTRPPKETKRHLLGALFSAIVPGAGQLFLGQRRKGTVLLLVFAAVLLGFWPLRLLRSYAGLIFVFAAWTVLYLYAASSAQLTRKGPTDARLSRWWLVLTIPFTFVTLSVLGGIMTRASGFRSFSIPSTSMEKTLRQGDAFVVDITSRRAERREVVIFFRNGTYFVKRVIATSGDSIQGKRGAVFLNGNEQDEPYVEHTGVGWQEDWMSNFGPTTVPVGKCFVMGDNRDVSLDSRSTEFGLVDEASIIGKPLYIFKSDGPGKEIR